MSSCRCRTRLQGNQTEVFFSFSGIFGVKFRGSSDLPRHDLKTLTCNIATAWSFWCLGSMTGRLTSDPYLTSPLLRLQDTPNTEREFSVTFCDLHVLLGQNDTQSHGSVDQPTHFSSERISEEKCARRGGALIETYCVPSEVLGVGWLRGRTGCVL